MAEQADSEVAKDACSQPGFLPLPSSLAEFLDAEPQALTSDRCSWLRGVVLSRRVLSRHLAFCTLKLQERRHSLHGAWSSEPGGQSNVLGLCFTAALVTADPEAGVDNCSTECWELCPGRRGDLPVGTQLEALVVAAPAYRPEPLVRRWRKLTASTCDVDVQPEDVGPHDMAAHHAGRDAVNRAAKLELEMLGRPVALCKFWSGRAAGYCDGSCSFRHHFENSEEEAKVSEAVAARERSQAAAAAELLAYDDVVDRAHDTTDEKAGKGKRAWRFASWLVQQYGREALQAGCGVLDVAGGQGDLSWALSVEEGVPCTLVDPGVRRGGLLKSWQRRALRKRGRDEAFTRLPVEFNEQLFCTSEVSTISDSSEPPPATYAYLLSGASLVVGLHPDEATEAIVDLALRSGRKFAVVPCCVFAQKFQGRELSPGVPVRTLNQFCAYLRKKDSRIQEALLDFEGRNKVLFIP